MTDEKFLIKVGSAIKRIRTRKNISQIKLASLCDFEKASMSRIESGQTNVTILTLRKIAVALNSPLSDFFL